MFDKRGRDGSAKANLRREAGGRVWGALYALASADWARLDPFERGYARIRIDVFLEGAEAAIAAETYRSEDRIADPRPLASYLALVVAGARERGLPREYLDALARTPVIDAAAPAAPAAE